LELVNDKIQRLNEMFSERYFIIIIRYYPFHYTPLASELTDLTKFGFTEKKDDQGKVQENQQEEQIEKEKVAENDQSKENAAEIIDGEKENKAEGKEENVADSKQESIKHINEKAQEKPAENVEKVENSNPTLETKEKTSKMERVNNIAFEMASPFLPFEQLMAVLPPKSAK